MRLRTVARLLTLLAVVGGLSAVGGVMFSVRGSLQQRNACQAGCFPFVSRVASDVCECADLDGVFHPEGW